MAAARAHSKAMDEPSRPALRVRADIADLAPYASPRLPARYTLNSNESPYPPPEGLVRDVVRRLERSSFNRYPDDEARALARAVGAASAWPESGVWLANGSNEIFLHLFLGFGGPDRSVLVFEPTYSLHSTIPRITGTRVHRAPRDEELLIDLDDAVRVIRTVSPEIVVVCSPNNPTGACEPLATVRALLEEAPGIVVVDEAYIEFAEPSESARGLLDEYANLALVRTFSKAWRLAGVRIGYMLTHPSLVQELGRVRLPYSLSVLTQAVGLAALEHSGETLEAVAAIVDERERVALELQAMGVMALPSRANFVLFEMGDAERAWRELLDRGVLVRNYSGVEGLSGCLRVTIGRQEENDVFLAAMGEVLDG